MMKDEVSTLSHFVANNPNANYQIVNTVRCGDHNAINLDLLGLVKADITVEYGLCWVVTGIVA